MFLKFYDVARNEYIAVNTDVTEKISYKEQKILIDRGYPYKQYDSDEVGLAQFNDVLDAMASEKVAIYDLQKESGYWKKSKPGPKPKPAPAPAEK